MAKRQVVGRSGADPGVFSFCMASAVSLSLHILFPIFTLFQPQEMAHFLRGKQAGIQKDLSEGLSPDLFLLDDVGLGIPGIFVSRN